MNRPAKTDKVKRKRPSSAHPSKLPRTSVLYWRNKVEHTISQNGSVNVSYSVRIEWRKRRVRFSFETSNKNTAASKAAKIYTFLIEHGWDATIEKYKPHTIKETPEEFTLGKTVGDLIQANKKYTSAREQTLQAYIQAFRRIVSGVMEQEYDSFLTRKQCGTDAWRVQVDSVSLSELTPARIQNWKQHFLKKHGKTASAKRKTTTTVNSLVRNAKALFSKKLIQFIENDVEIPSPLPFEGVTMEKPPSPRYHSKIDAKVILEKSHQELEKIDPEAYKMLILARDEIQFNDLRQRKTILYIVVPSKKLKLYSPLLNLFYTQFFAAQDDLRYTTQGLPLYVLYDEFGHSMIPNFDTIATTIRKYRVSLSIILQDYGQLRKQYGDHAAKTILAGGMRSKVFYAGLDTETATMVEKMLGTVEYEYKKNGHKSWRNTNLMNADRISRMEVDQALCISSNHEPILLNTTPCYKNRHLDRLMQYTPYTLPSPLPTNNLNYVSLT